MWSWSLLLLGFVTVSGLVVGPAQPVPLQCRGYSLSLLFYLCAYRLSLYPLFVYFLYGLIVSLHIGFPWGGCALRALDVTSDWVSLAPFLALPGLCGLVD